MTITSKFNTSKMTDLIYERFSLEQILKIKSKLYLINILDLYVSVKKIICDIEKF